METNIEIHPLEPFIPKNGRILMLGSFPPPRVRWAMDFYYPNPQNDFWRIMGIVFYGERDHFADGKQFDRKRIEGFCNERGIAFSDTARSVVRLAGNASDDMLQIVERRDIGELLCKMPDCIAIATTGGKAAETLTHIIPSPLPSVGSHVEAVHGGRTINIYRMPSSSRAYPLSIQRKAEIYARMFAQAGIL